MRPQSLLTAEAQRSVEHHFSSQPGVYGTFVHGVRAALTSGIVDVFTIGLALAALALVLVGFMPRIELATWETPRARSADPTPEAGEAAASISLTAPADRS